MRWSNPSERNYSIFCEIEFDGRSLRTVAMEYGISVVRVQQIVEQVRKWFVANAPAWMKGTDPVLQPLVAAQFFEHKMQHLTRQAMTAWENSQGEKTVTHTTPGPMEYVSKGQSRTSYSAGETKYLALAARLADLQLKSAMRVADWRIEHREEEAEALAKYADLPEYPMFAEEEEPAREEGVATPCARESEKVNDGGETGADVLAPSTETDATYTLDDAIASRLLMRAKTPVRSRKERRQRQRQLDRALGNKR
jgi:hypothetical protein